MFIGVKTVSTTARMLRHLCVFLCFVAIVNAATFASVDLAYKKGFEAYSGERWSECVTQFEEALHLYKLHKSIIISCKLKCNSQFYESAIMENIDDLKMYERFFLVGNCIKDCQDKEFQNVRLFSDIKDSVKTKLESQAPYEYLQMCYYQMGDLPRAASAAYTHLVANPTSEMSVDNMKYYVAQQEVDKDEVVDLESNDFQIMHRLGVNLYKEEKWREATAALEEALADYMAWENGCRVECDSLPEQQWASDFIITTSNNMASLLQCRQLCQDKLKTLNYNSGVEFVADVLNYLQMSYYKMDKYDDGADAAASYLVLMPEDEDMLHNSKVYRTLIDTKSVTERPNILYYFKRDTYEKNLLNLFHDKHNNNTYTNSI